MRLTALTAVGFGAYFVSALAIPESHAVHERRESAPRQWVKRNKAPSKAVLPMRIGLRQSNLEKGNEFLMDISHPASANYGKHWSSEDVIEMFKPSNESVDTVKAWLVSSGIPKHRIVLSDNKGWLAFDATTEESEKLLHTEYHLYEHRNGHAMAACDEYHVPKAIQEHIDYITPGIILQAPEKGARAKRGISRGGVNSLKLFPLPKDAAKSPSDLSTCDQAITPACVAALYHIPRATKADPRNAMGIFEQGDYYAQEDLDLFFAKFTPYIPNGTKPILQGVDGALAPTTLSNAGTESSLDFELAYPILYPQSIKLFQTDDINYATGVIPTVGGFNTLLDAIDGSYCTYCAFGECGDDKNDPVYPDTLPGGYRGQLQCGVYQPTNVLSISYGGPEHDVPPYYQQRQCNEFLKLGLQGVSIFVASGDYGVAARQNLDSPNGCLGGDSTTNGTIFNPKWPSNCPWVTGVGATKVYPGQTVNGPESGLLDSGFDVGITFSSGGGFSNIHSTPLYQLTAVSEFFEEHDPPYNYFNGNSSIGKDGGVYNRIGRGSPDVAANGDNIDIFAGGEEFLEGGTSASAPIFASVINRINEERLAIGKGPVGFINPVLYANPSVLNDITNGTNPGCGTPGFSAVKGWDPVTGIGTPNFPKMLALFLSLP